MATLPIPAGVPTAKSDDLLTAIPVYGRLSAVAGLLKRPVELEVGNREKLRMKSFI
jgi:hypothetical protein